MPVTEFVGLGLAGLTSLPSIRKYRAGTLCPAAKPTVARDLTGVTNLTGAKAIADGFATDVKPGDLIDLPITIQ